MLHFILPFLKNLKHQQTSIQNQQKFLEEARKTKMSDGPNRVFFAFPPKFRVWKDVVDGDELELMFLDFFTPYLQRGAGVLSCSTARFIACRTMKRISKHKSCFN